MYAQGIGVTKDYVQSYVWFTLAAATDAQFSQHRDQLAKLLSPDQIAKAQQLALDWKPTPP
jgi:TPR repeat protein